MKLESDLSEAEQNWKTLKNSLKISEKELHDKQKECTFVNENLVKVRHEFDKLTTQVNTEKRNLEKKQKKSEKKECLVFR